MRIASIFLQFGLNVIIKEDFKSLFSDGLPFLAACFRCFPLRDHYSVLRYDIVDIDICVFDNRNLCAFSNLATSLKVRN